GSYWSPWPGSVQSIMGADYAFYQTFLANPDQHQELNHDEQAQTLSSQSKPMISVPAARAPESTDEHEEHASHYPLPELDWMPLRVSPLIQTNGKRPKVSCILATGNRPAFTRQAIRCFLRQTFDDSELIVVDDGTRSIEQLCAGLFRVRYIRLDQPTTLGSKLNIGIEHSTGEIIQKLDDDDFYQQDFLARSVGALMDASDERAIVTWDCFSIFIAGESCVRYSGHGWTTGGTLSFHRRLWDERQFRDEPRRVDTWFIEDHDPRLVKICAPDLYMLVRHGRNTWGRLDTGFPVDAYFKTLSPHHKSLDEVIETIDRPFYHWLAKEGAR
ncbi:MAG: glycosyltransferase family 2 protein, partial [Pyrinomonadaceae bacterium]|nr:glycosyltransferase family 2 protein [Pyrinomonadaceae bacterium]